MTSQTTAGGLHINAPLVEFGSPSAVRKLIRQWHNLLIITPAEGAGLTAASRLQPALHCPSYARGRRYTDTFHCPRPSRDRYQRACTFNGLVLLTGPTVMQNQPAMAKTTAGTHCTYPQKDVKAELVCVAGYISRWYTHISVLIRLNTQHRVTSMTCATPLPLSQTATATTMSTNQKCQLKAFCFLYF